MTPIAKDSSSHLDSVIEKLQRYYDLLEKQLENKKILIGGEAQNQDQTDRAQYNNHRVPPVEPPNDEGV